MQLDRGVEGRRPGNQKAGCTLPSCLFNMPPARRSARSPIIIIFQAIDPEPETATASPRCRSVGTPPTFSTCLRLVACIVVISHESGRCADLHVPVCRHGLWRRRERWWFPRRRGRRRRTARSPYLWGNVHISRDDQKQRILARIDPSISPDGLGVPVPSRTKALEALRTRRADGARSVPRRPDRAFGYTGPPKHTDSYLPFPKTKHWRAARHARLPCRPVPDLLAHRPALQCRSDMKSPDYMKPPLICIRPRLELLFPDPQQRRASAVGRCPGRTGRALPFFF